MKRDRQARGEPEPRWFEDPLLFIFVSLFLLAVTVATVQFFAASPQIALLAGLIVVVLLGASGLVCRGIGELKASPRWKAVGYFFGASAYLVTATVALLNGFKILK